MSQGAKCDNHFLDAKLELRRRILKEQKQFDRLSVVDCFSGSETIWTALRKEFKVAEYLALDTKAKKARLKIDSLRYLENQKWEHNVIDLDAYGSPWRHWFEVLKRGKSCIVFLTVGNTLFKIQQTEAIKTLGIDFKLPGGLQGALAELICDHCLAALFDFGFAVKSAYEAKNPGGNARYFGIELVKMDTSTASRRKKSA